MSFKERFAKAWNAFRNPRDPTEDYQNDEIYYPSPTIPYTHRLQKYGTRSIINPIINRIATDCASICIEHAKLDDNGQYKETIYSGLQNCLQWEANPDQAARAFRLDVYMSLLDEGAVAVFPYVTDDEPSTEHASFEVLAMRTAKIVQWYPKSVKIECYNEFTGQIDTLKVDKDAVVIVENPFFSIMNEPNGTLQRLIKKYSLLDAIDEQSSSGKLDLIIQLPYVIKSQARREEANKRRKEIETQLTGSKYGIAYTDGTERITQLNRPVENTLNAQIDKLEQELYNQLGLTQSIFDGTADESTMLNYYNRTIEPIVAAFVEELNRKCLSKNARTQKQKIVYFRDPFKLVPLEKLADIADKFTRNEIMSSNEMRGIIGYKPVDTPEANELRNKNLNREVGETPSPLNNTSEGGENQNEEKL